MTLYNHQGLFVTLAILYFLAISLPSAIGSSLPIPSESSIHKHDPWEDSYKFTTYHPGQNYKGLSNVKSYFHELGYISNVPPSNFNDNFDDNLVTAIQTYQTMYKLNPTGKFDHNTLRHLMMPRCGFPDIIKTNTKTSFGGDYNIHTVSHYSTIGNRRWPAKFKELTYAFAAKNKLNDTSKTTIANAFNRWTPELKIPFKETASYNTANIKVSFEDKYHGDRNPFKQYVTAHAFPPTDGRLHFNNNYTWVASGDVTTRTEPNAMDLESVAVHEIGHTLGLGHSDNSSAIMFSVLPVKTRKVNLTADDIEGIQYLYNIKP